MLMCCKMSLFHTMHNIESMQIKPSAPSLASIWNLASSVKFLGSGIQNVESRGQMLETKSQNFLNLESKI